MLSKESINLSSLILEAQSFAAKKHNVFIFSKPISCGALKVLSSGGTPKSRHISMKTVREGIHAGYIFCDDSDHPTREIFRRNVLTTKCGSPITSDLDILKIVPKDTDHSTPYYNEEYGFVSDLELSCIKTLNMNFSSMWTGGNCGNIVQHGPFDRFMNICPLQLKYPINLFYPNGEREVVRSISQYRSIERNYEKLGILFGDS